MCALLCQACYGDLSISHARLTGPEAAPRCRRDSQPIARIT